MKFGNPWHGPVDGAGYATLPNGTQRWVGTRDPGCSLIRFAGIPVPETTAEEAALGMRWDDYALLSGISARQLYNKMALPGLTWLFRDVSGAVWRLRFKPTSATAGTLAIGSTVVVGFQILARRFGVLGAQLSDETVIHTGTLTFTIMFDWGRCLSGFWMTHSPDGSHALIHPVCSSYAYTEAEILASSIYPDYTTAIPNSSASAIFEVTIASGSAGSAPQVSSVLSVAHGDEMRVEDDPVVTGVPAELFENLVTPPTSVSASYGYNAYWWAQNVYNKVSVSGGYIYPMDGDGVIHYVTHEQWVEGGAAVTMLTRSEMVLFGAYKPTGERVVFKQVTETYVDSASNVTGTVDPVYGTGDQSGTTIGYSADLSVATHSYTTTTTSIVADGGPASPEVSVVVIDNYVRSGTGAAYAAGVNQYLTAFLAAIDEVPNIRNKTVDGLGVYSGGEIVVGGPPENVGVQLFLPMLAGLNLRPATGSAVWRRVCSPISTYDHGSYVSDNGLVWHPVEDIFAPSSSGTRGFI